MTISSEKKQNGFELEVAPNYIYKSSKYKSKKLRKRVLVFFFVVFLIYIYRATALHEIARRAMNGSACAIEICLYC